MQPDLLSAVTAAFEIAPADGLWTEPTLQLLYQNLPPQERQAAIRHVAQQLNQGQLAIDWLLAARTRYRVLGAILAQPPQHGAAFLFPPVVAALPGTDVAVALIGQATSRLKAAGCRLIQCVRHPGDRRVAQWLDQCGFRSQGRMLILDHDLSNVSPDSLPESSSLTWRTGTAAEFTALMSRTLVNSLDFPDLAALRTPAQILDSHRAAGDSGDSLWRIGELRDQSLGSPVAALLMAAHEAEQLLEVLYVGVVPEARGRGLGRDSMKTALRLAQQRGATRVRLHALDTNHYAMNIYNSLSFKETGSAAFHLWISERSFPAGK